MPGVARANARVAVESKRQRKLGTGEPSPALLEARRVLAEEKLKQYIQQVVASAPPLDEDTKARLALLLSGA